MENELKERPKAAQSNKKKWQKRIGWALLIALGILLVVTIVPWIVMFFVIVFGNFAP
ncbi:hypothetical protein MAUB1S_11538 [Mycolicibacterium aubagnense]